MQSHLIHMTVLHTYLIKKSIVTPHTHDSIKIMLHTYLIKKSIQSHPTHMTV
jgi:hypothetical protein